MSLDIYLNGEGAEDWDFNITHNLNLMADFIGLYQPLWRPEEIGVKKAWQLGALVGIGLKRLRKFPTACREFNPENGWGTYEGFVGFCERLLRACHECPEADISVSR